MLLTDWFFTVDISQPPKDASALLESLTVLRDRQSPTVLCRFALEHLAGCEQLPRAYAVPDLIELLFDAHLDPELESGVREIIIRTAGDSTLLRKLLGLVAAKPNEIAARLRTIKTRAPRPVATNYLELGDVASELVYLAVLREAARGNWDAVEGLIGGDDAPALYSAARSGKLGRLPFALAIEIAAICGKEDEWLPDVRSLGNPPTGWLGQPDLVELVVRLTPFANGVGGRLREAVTFERLAALIGVEAGGTPQPDIAWLGSRYDDGFAAALVLWQAAQWSCAAAADPQQTARHLEQVWGAPEPLGTDAAITIAPAWRDSDAMARALVRLGWLRNRPNQQAADPTVGVGDPERAASSLRSLHSPWLDRSLEKQHLGDAIDKYPDSRHPNYHQVDNPVAVLRLLASVEPLDTMVRRARSNQEIPGFIISHLLGLGGALSNRRLRVPVQQIVRKDDLDFSAHSPFGHALLTLCVHVTQRVDRIGKGTTNESVPDALVRFLEKNAVSEVPAAPTESEQRWNTQERNLYAQAAPLIAARWAKETYSGYIGAAAIGALDRPRTVPSAAAAWFDGYAQSPAAVLVKRILGAFWDYMEAAQPGSENEALYDAALLAAEAFPDVLARFGRSGNWLGRYRAFDSDPNGKNPKVTWRAPLLAAPMRVADWGSLGSLRLERFESGARLSVLTMRLLALLGQGDVTEAHEWVETWQHAVSEVNSPGTLARPTRAALTEIVAARAPVRYADVVHQVQASTVDAVVEFSANTIHYQFAVLERLRNDYALGAASREELQVRWFEAAVRQQEFDDRGSTAGPWARYGGYETRALRDALVERLVYGALDASEQAAPLVRQLLGVWQDTGRALLPMVQTDDIEADPREVLSYQRRDAEMHVGWRGTASPGTAADLFRGHPSDSGSFVGIVAAVDHSTARVLVNRGAADVEERVVYDRAPMEIGDLVALNPDRGLTMLRPVVGPVGARGDAEVAIDRNGLHLTINGVVITADLDDPRVASQWDPDFLTPVEEGPSGTTVRVYLDSARGIWLPERRGFAQLIVEEFGADLSRALTVTVVESLEIDDAIALVLSVRLGVVYEIPRSIWEPNSQSVLDDVLNKPEELPDIGGLRLTLRLTTVDGEPRLALGADGESAPADAIDRRNIDWRHLFDSGAPVDIFREGAVWYTTASIPGQPELIEVDLGDEVVRAGSGRARLVAGGWDLRAQRLACVTMQLVRSRTLEPEVGDIGALRELLDVHVGEAVRLHSLTSDVDDGWLRSRTVVGHEVEVAVESLTFGRDSIPRAKYARRLAVVAEVSFGPRTGRQAPPAEFDLGIPVPDVVLEMPGVVRGYGPDDERFPTWVEVNGVPYTVDVPLGAFDECPTRLGDLVTLRRGGGAGWIATARHRRIRVRALWSLVSASGREVTAGIALGNVDLPGVGTVGAIEDPKLPVIHYRDRHRTPPTELYGAKVKEGTVRQVVPNVSGAPERALVRLRAGGSTLYGEARPGAFARGNLTWSSSHLLAQPVATPGVESIDLRRVFEPGKAVRRAAAPPAAATVARGVYPSSWWERFLDWEREGTFVVRGRFDVGRGRPKRIELSGLTLADPSANGPADAAAITAVEVRSYRGWLDETYDRNDVRAKVTWSDPDQTWTADCRAVPPMSVRDLETHIGKSRKVVRGKPVEFSIRFAGRTKSGAFRFEWGYGWTVHVPPDGLMVGGSTEWSPFFGDLITKFAFEYRQVGARKLLCLVVDPRAVRWGVEKYVWQDAELRILQQVRVLVYPNGGRVIVTGVKTRTRDIVSGTQQRHMRLRNAKFTDPDDVDRIRNLLTPQEQADGKGVSFDVYARVDLSKHPDDHRSLRLQAVIGDESEGGRTPKLGEYVFLIAGVIEEKHAPGNRGGNDYHVMFRSPPDVRGVDDRHRLSVRVNRREFSFRESTLRTLFRTRPQTFVGSPMLVQLWRTPDARRIWTGDLRTVPFRTSGHVRDWLSTIGEAQVIAGSVVAQRTKNGKTRKQLSVEIAPGVLAAIDVTGRDHIPRPGTICGIRRGRDAPVLYPVVEPDQDFVSHGLRPALVFLKDDTTRARGGKGHADMTIAGLPSLTIADAAFAGRLSGVEHPRFAVLFRAEGKPVLRRGAVNAGSVWINEWDVPRVRSARGSNPYPTGRKTSWSQLSFLDGDASEIARHAKRGSWRYHDRSTGYWPRGASKPEFAPLPDPVSAADGPLFFTDDWRLRYPAADLMRFGYPATEITESGLPGDGGWYPVAGTTATAVWIELSPGRVVKVPGNLLFAESSRRPSLRSVLWRVFAPGDQLRITRRTTHDGQVADLALTDWRIGPRGFFHDANVLLPVRERSRRGALLGDGPWQFGYPLTDRFKELPAGEYCWLTPENDLRVRSVRTVTEGDVVFLSFDEQTQRFEVGGLEDAEVQFAQRWRGQEWLRRLLVDTDTRAATMRALGGHYPARVIEITEHTVTLGPTGGAGAQVDGAGATIPVSVLGLVDSGRALLRAGAVLVLLDVDELVLGVPEQARAAVVERLAKRTPQVWLSWDGDRWRSAAVNTKTPLEVDAVTDAGSHSGVVVRDRASSALLWLELENVGLVAGASSADVTNALRILDRPLPVFRTPAGGLSAIDPATVARLHRIPSGQPISVRALVRIDAASDSAYSTYVASVHPSTTLVALRTETQVTHNAPIGAEIVRVRDDSVVVVPAGNTRTEIDLPRWMIRALRAAHRHGRVDPTAFRAIANERLEPFLEAMRRGPAVLSDGPSAARVMAAWAAARAGDLPTEHRAEALRALTDWLDEHGEVLLAGIGDEPPSDHVDAAPALAALLLADAILRQGIVRSSELGQLTVHLAHVIGLVAAGSMHSEVLLGSWLLAPEADMREGQWLRLNKLLLFGLGLGTSSPKAGQTFDGTLNATQRAEVLNLCRGILGRRHRIDDRALIDTVSALQYSVLTAESLDLVWPAFARTNCARIAAQGRGLTPGATVSVSQPNLHATQTAELALIAEAILNSRIPVTLNLRNRPEPTARAAKWAIETLSAVRRALKSAAETYTSKE